MAGSRWSTSLAVAILLLGLSIHTHARRQHARIGMKKGGLTQYMIQRACVVVDMDDTTLVHDECDTGFACTQGPLVLESQDKFVKAYYCTNFQLTRWLKLKLKIHGLCRVEADDDVLFQWNCKHDVDCQHGPRDMTYDGRDAQAYYCHPPYIYPSERSEKPGHNWRLKGDRKTWGNPEEQDKDLKNYWKVFWKQFGKRNQRSSNKHSSNGSKFLIRGTPTMNAINTFPKKAEEKGNPRWPNPQNGGNIGNNRTPKSEHHFEADKTQPRVFPIRAHAGKRQPDAGGSELKTKADPKIRNSDKQIAGENVQSGHGVSGGHRASPGRRAFRHHVRNVANLVKQHSEKLKRKHHRDGKKTRPTAENNENDRRLERNGNHRSKTHRDHHHERDNIPADSAELESLEETTASSESAPFARRPFTRLAGSRRSRQHHSKQSVDHSKNQQQAVWTEYNMDSEGEDSIQTSVETLKTNSWEDKQLGNESDEGDEDDDDNDDEDDDDDDEDDYDDIDSDDANEDEVQKLYNDWGIKL